MRRIRSISGHGISADLTGSIVHLRQLIATCSATDVVEVRGSDVFDNLVCQRFELMVCDLAFGCVESRDLRQSVMADERAAIMTHLVGSRHPEPAWAEGGREAMTAAAIPLSVPLDEYLPVCTAQPERWTTTTPDEYAKAACQACPRRWLCASEACQVPGVEGLWAGVVIPESGRSREFALRRLRYLAERGGYQARPRRRGRPRGSRN